MKILLTGSTGYIGGRLAPLLLQREHELVCLVRDPRKLRDRPWAGDDRVTLAEGDVSDSACVARAAAGCEAAYYLVHAMEAGSHDFVTRDRELAQSFADAMRGESVGRVIYLGGLGELGSGLSEHLRSRREVETVLESSGVPVTSFRAAMILGSGSASFEILRYLVERLPAMVTPKWVSTRCQPISVVDVLGYLVDCLDLPESAGEDLEIGGPTVLTYRALMDEMQRQLGLAKRFVVPVPVLTPRLSSLWIGLVTPVSPAIARPLAEGLRNEVVVTNDRAEQLMPRHTLPPREAIRRALERIARNEVATRWSAAGPIPGDPDWAGGTSFVDERTITINAPASDVFRAVCRVGGGHGWYAANVLWKIRGFMDQLIGGPGTRRGRRDVESVEFGEALDFWRVTGVERNKHLRLRAEMKVPGIAELAFKIEPTDTTESQLLTMTARFRPKGLIGLAYWYSVLPFHNIVFSGMLRGMKRAAETMDAQRARRETSAQPAAVS